MGPAEVTASSDRDSEVAPDRLQCLEVAERLIRQRESIGRLGDDTLWIDDELDMYWGLAYPSNALSGSPAVVSWAKGTVMSSPWAAPPITC
jgi:hypothetical protein